MAEKKESAGLGRIIYSLDDQGKKKSPPDDPEERAERAEVEEADTESFPASDPPSFAGGKDADCQ